MRLLLNLNDMTKDKYKKIVLTWGYVALLMIQEDLLQYEKYEYCKPIQDAFYELETMIDFKYPRKLSDVNIEDYKQNFWRLGLSGDIAVSNLYSYTRNAWDYLMKDNHKET